MAIRIKIIFIIFLLSIPAYSFSQTINDSINKGSIEKAITYLASDQLKGRVNFSIEQLKAAEYLSKEFRGYGLDPYPGYTNFYIPFRASPGDNNDPGDAGNKDESGKLYLNGRKIDDSLYIFIQKQLVVSEIKMSDFMVLQAVPPLAGSLIYNNWENKQDNILIWVPLPKGLSFSEAIKNVLLPYGVPASNILIVASQDEPKEIKFSGNKRFVNSVLYNVVGILPGRSLPGESIIFSAHYDHVDRGVTDVAEGIYNGANDDASGTTAVLALAKYFAMRNDNERTLIFCLFAGEELGEYGSTAFTSLIKPSTIKAVINIEMIGMTNATGENAFFVTGSYLSDMTSILRKNLKGGNVEVMDQNFDPKLLFQRSDNYPFAKEGIPAHSIMCSDDNEPCYHKTCDDVKRIDMDNMTRIIQAIAKSCTSLINGKDTPTRIKN